MNQDAISQKDFKDIGIGLYKIEPAIATRILSMIVKIKPERTQLNEIQPMFMHFCKYMNYEYGNILNHKKRTIYIKYVFIAVIIKIYNPELITGYHLPNMKRNLRCKLSSVLHMNASWISQKIPMILLWLNIYENFSNDVNGALNELRQWN